MELANDFTSPIIGLARARFIRIIFDYTLSLMEYPHLSASLLINKSSRLYLSGTENNLSSE